MPPHKARRFVGLLESLEEHPNLSLTQLVADTFVEELRERRKLEGCNVVEKWHPPQFQVVLWISGSFPNFERLNRTH